MSGGRSRARRAALALCAPLALCAATATAQTQAEPELAAAPVALAPFVGSQTHRVLVAPHATLEVGTCRLAGASHSGDTVVTLSPDRSLPITSDDAAGCSLGSFAEWTAGERATAVEIRVGCFSNGIDCSGVLAWSVRPARAERVETFDAQRELSIAVPLGHGRALRVETLSQQGDVEYMLVNQVGAAVDRRASSRPGVVQFSTPFEERATYRLVGRCARGPCSARARVVLELAPRHFTTSWELAVGARAAVGGGAGSAAVGGGVDAHVYGRAGHFALRVETPTIGAMWSPSGGVFVAGVRGLAAYATDGAVVGAGVGALTLNRRIGGIRERVWPEALAWLRVGNAAASLDLVLGATIGAQSQPWLSLAKAQLWARVAREVDIGVLGVYSIGGEVRFDAALRYWVRGRGVDAGSWGIGGSLGYTELFYQPQCPLGPCSDTLSYSSATLGVALTWRP